MGERPFGIDPDVVARIADEIGEVHGLGRRDRGRRRRGQHHSRDGRRGAGDRPRRRRSHGSARDGDQRPRSAGRAREEEHLQPADVGGRGAADRRAVHPAPRDASPREGTRRAFRGGHRQPLLHDRLRRRAARQRDPRGRAPQSDAGGRRLRRQPGKRREREVPQEADLPAGAREGPPGHGRGRRSRSAWTTAFRSRCSTSASGGTSCGSSRARTSARSCRQRARGA